MTNAVKSSDLLSQYKKLTKDDSSENNTAGQERLNYYYAFLLSEANNYIVERTKYGNLKDGQRSYLLPPDYYKIKTVRVKINNNWYPVTEVWGLEKWHYKTQKTGASAEGTIAREFIVINEQGNVHLELDPVPDTDLTDALEIVYEGYQDRLTFPTDHSAGTITATKGSPTIEGAGSPAWTSNMAGRFLRPTNGKFWYDIKTITDADTLVLVNMFQEANIAGSNYEIAELLRLPPEFHKTPLWGSVMEYYSVGNEAKSRQFERMYTRDLLLLQNKYQSKTKGRVMRGKPVGRNLSPVPFNYPNSAINQ